MNIVGSVLKHADLHRAHLQRAYANEAVLAGANLWNADLKEANLRKARMEDSKLMLADFGGANLDCAVLTNADVQLAIFTAATLRGSDLRKVKNLNAEQLLAAKSLFDVKVDDSVRDQIMKHVRYQELSSTPTDFPPCSGPD